MFEGPPRECGGMAEVLVSDSVRVGDGAAAGLPGAKVFQVRSPQQARHRTLDRASHTRCPFRKVLRSLTRAESGAIRRICFHAHVCVVEGRFARREQAKGATGRGRRMKRRDRFAPQDETKAQSVGAAGERPARETGKPGAGCDAAVRPHGRMRDRPKADVSPATRAAEQGRRPSGLPGRPPIDVLN